MGLMKEVDMNDYMKLVGHCFIAAAIIYHGLLTQSNMFNSLPDFGLVITLFFMTFGMFIFFFRRNKQ